MRPTPFRIDIDQTTLDDLRCRLKRVRWAEDLADEDWLYGTQTAYLKELVAYWVDHYDWRLHEREMNRFTHYRVELDGTPIHFMHVPGSGVRPIPLILTHGWPWTFWDFQKVVGPLSDPVAFGGRQEDAFDVVVPSLPGFGFSTPLRTSGISYARTADLWADLMSDVLGHQRFAAHGSDFGLVVTEQLGHKYADRMIGIHVQGGSPLDYFTGGAALASDYGPEDAGRVARNAAFMRSELGYMALQTTKPQTLAHALNDSPLGLCAWILEKRRSWSHGTDVEARFSKDDLITAAMLYWVTQSYGSSARFYYESAHHPWTPSHDRMPVIEAPTGVLVFEHDIIGMPKPWAERYMDLRRYTVVQDGGHFGAMENPAAWIDDVRAFFRQLR